jgi:predicted dehydrogenase
MKRSSASHQIHRKAPSRRDFLKRSTAVLGASAVGALALEPVRAAGSDVIKLGLIGCGGRGTGAAHQALNADRGARIVAVADVFAGHARRCVNSLKQAKPEQVSVDDDHCFVGFDAWKKVIESDVDAVLIACSSRYHPQYLKAGVDAGRHVFVEKPHAIDPPGIRVVLEACEEAKKKNLCVVSGLHRRYDRGIRETLQRILDGAIGDIVAAEVTFLRPPYQVVQRDPKWSELEWQFKTWYHFNWLSGDDVPQSMVHTIDTAQWALREETPVSAHGLGGRSASIATVYGNVFDHHTCVFEYASGARVYGMVRTQHGCHGEVATKLFGTKGNAHVDGRRIWGAVNWRFEGKVPGGHQQEQIDFMAAIRAGETINNGLYMARSTRIGIMGQLACYTGKKLTWDQVCKSGFSYPPTSGEINFEIDPPVKPDANGIYPVPVPGKSEMI